LFSLVFVEDWIVVFLDFTTQEVIFISAQSIVIILVAFLQLAVMVSLPVKVNFVKLGSNVNL